MSSCCFSQLGIQNVRFVDVKRVYIRRRNRDIFLIFFNLISKDQRVILCAKSLNNIRRYKNVIRSDVTIMH